MTTLTLILDILGTVAFVISGAITALEKKMDIFGVVILGLTTAVGGGVTVLLRLLAARYHWNLPKAE